MVRAKILVCWLALGPSGFGCAGHHEARLTTVDLAPPPFDRVLHTSRIVVHVRAATTDQQCVVDADKRPVCFEDVRAHLERSLARSLWPSFPGVVTSSVEPLAPGDYLLEVEVTLDALAPDRNGPGWSAGAKSRFRLTRDAKLLREETLASRSRAEFAYGAPLAVGASEVLDATALHVATRVGSVPELRPLPRSPLPRVHAHVLSSLGDPAPTASP